MISVLLSSCSTDTTQQPKPTSIAPTPTSTTPANTVLYQADWSHGLHDWKNSGGWKIVAGTLQSDTRADNVLTIPYTPGVPDYMVEFRCKIVRVAKTGANIALQAEQSGTLDGYHAAIEHLQVPSPQISGVHPWMEAYIKPLGSTSSQEYATQDYEPRTDWHTYRVEVNANHMLFYIDDVRAARVSSSHTQNLSRGPLQFRSSQVIVVIDQLKIATL